MKLPRFLFRPLARHYFMLWRMERRKVIKLEAEIKEWRDRLFEKVNVRPLFKPEPKPAEPVRRPPIGISQKRAWVQSEKNKQPDNAPSTETILEATEKAKTS